MIKTCPICLKPLPLSDFSFNRSRRDGHNLYCKDCTNAKVRASRRRVKEYNDERKKYATIETNPVLAFSKMTPLEKVKDSIRRGLNTQREIRAETKLCKDEICDHLAVLLLDLEEIKTKEVDGIRIYLINEPEEQKMGYPIAKPFFDVARKAGAPVVRGERRKVA